jgi:hypothetical protein
MKKLFLLFFFCCIALCSCSKKEEKHSSENLGGGEEKHSSTYELAEDIKNASTFFVIRQITETEGQGSDNNPSENTRSDGAIIVRSSEQSFNYNLEDGEIGIFAQTFIRDSITLDNYQKWKDGSWKIHWPSYYYTDEADMHNKILDIIRRANDFKLGPRRDDPSITATATVSQIAFFAQPSNAGKLADSGNNLNLHDASTSSAVLITMGKALTSYFGNTDYIYETMTKTTRAISKTETLPPLRGPEALPNSEQEN